MSEWRAYKHWIFDRNNNHVFDPDTIPWSNEWAQKIVEEHNEALRVQLTLATEKMGRMEKALEKITGGVDHALGIKASPEFYECLDWAQSIAREALSDIKNSGGKEL